MAKTKGSKMVSIRNHSAVHRTAYMASQEINRGQAILDKIQTVLTSLRYDFGVRNIQKTDAGKIEQYLQSLIEKVEDEKLSRVTAASYVSALNTALNYADRSDLTVSAKEYGLSKGIRTYSDLSNSQESHSKFVEFLQNKDHNTANYIALSKSIEIQRELGLRFRESTMIKDQAIGKALKTGILHIGKPDGTKNSRARNIPLSDQQIMLLKNTKNFMAVNKQHSLIDPNQTYDQYHTWSYNALKSFTNSNENYHFHGERHEFAHQRFQELWQEKTGSAIQAPVIAGKFKSDWIKYAADKTGLSSEQIKTIDHDIRLQVSHELGHGRIAIARDYLG